LLFASPHSSVGGSHEYRYCTCSSRQPDHGRHCSPHRSAGARTKPGPRRNRLHLHRDPRNLLSASHAAPEASSLPASKSQEMKLLLISLGIALVIIFAAGLAVFITAIAAGIAEEAIAHMPEGPEKDELRMKMLLAQQDGPLIF
jgi:hypothetical protein